MSTTSKEEKIPPLDFDPDGNPRELMRHYVSASEQDLAEMLEVVGVENIDDLFDRFYMFFC